MRTVAAGEFHKTPGVYQDLANHEPVSITRHGRVQWVLLSYREYTRLCKRRRIVSSAIDVDESTHAAIMRKDDIPESSARFDHELD